MHPSDLRIIYLLLLLAASGVRAQSSCNQVDDAPGIGPDDLTIAEHVERQWPAAISSLANDTRINQAYEVLDAYEDVRRKKQWDWFKCKFNVNAKKILIRQLLTEYVEHANKTAAMTRLFGSLYITLDENYHGHEFLCQPEYINDQKNNFIHVKALYALLYLIPENEIYGDPQLDSCRSEHFKLSLIVLMICVITVIVCICGYSMTVDSSMRAEKRERLERTRERLKRTRERRSMSAPVSDPEALVGTSFQGANSPENFTTGHEIAQYTCDHACVSRAVTIGDDKCPLCREPIIDNWVPRFYRSSVDEYSSDSTSPNTSSDALSESDN